MVPGRIQVRVWRRINTSGGSAACWLSSWSRANKRNGHTQIGWSEQGRRFNTVVHRVVWEQLVGPLNVGQHLHHECRNPACVNPAHLRIVTPQEHNQEHRDLWREEHPLCPHGHMDWRINKAGFRVCRVCERERKRRRRASRL